MQAGFCGDAHTASTHTHTQVRENVTFKIKELLTQTIESMSWKNRKIEEKSKEEVKKE